jgi:transcriptional regulator with GAF, ATPase, and Fis domain
MSARVANTTIPVLVQGETGVGKELVARRIHYSGRGRSKPMVCVNCGAIPAQLLESVLFGHEKGAFTGASRHRCGVFESAMGGTVLLDEVGELPPASQAALLRVLETKCVTRIGSNDEFEVDVRVIAATNRDLRAKCDEGAFRSDLLYRLNAMVIDIPPLRARRSEIEPLARLFLARACSSQGARITAIEDEVLNAFSTYPWPGNVRELKNTIDRAVVVAEGTAITLRDIPQSIRLFPRYRRERALESQSFGGEVACVRALDLRAEVDRFEAALIQGALERVAWDRKKAAQMLCLPLRTLSYRIKALGLAVDAKHQTHPRRER